MALATAASISASRSARMAASVSRLIGVPSFDAPTDQGRWRSSVAAAVDGRKTVVNEDRESGGGVLHRAVTARLSPVVDK